MPTLPSVFKVSKMSLDITSSSPRLTFEHLLHFASFSRDYMIYFISSYLTASLSILPCARRMCSICAIFWSVKYLSWNTISSRASDAQARRSLPRSMTITFKLSRYSGNISWKLLAKSSGFYGLKVFFWTPKSCYAKLMPTSPPSWESSSSPSVLSFCISKYPWLSLSDKAISRHLNPCGFFCLELILSRLRRSSSVPLMITS